jgi:hypothetical protein
MASAVEICSNALINLGDSPISDFGEATDNARRCNALYPSLRLALMRSHPWACLQERLILSPETAAPAFEWSYQFLLPSDCLRVLSVGETGFEIDYRLEGRKILANDNILNLIYLKDKVESDWDAMLTDGMILMMTWRLAWPVTKSAAVRDSVAREYDFFMKKARAVSGQENPPQTFGDTPLLNARFRHPFST